MAQLWIVRRYSRHREARVSEVSADGLFDFVHAVGEAADKLARRVWLGSVSAIAVSAAIAGLSFVYYVHRS